MIKICQILYTQSYVIILYTIFIFIKNKKNKKFNIYIFREIVNIRSKSDGSTVRNCENERFVNVVVQSVNGDRKARVEWIAHFKLFKYDYTSPPFRGI